MMLLEKPRIDLTSVATGGEPSSLGDIASTTIDAMQVVDNANSNRVAMERAYDDRIDGIYKATGQRLENPERADVRHRLAKSGSFGPLQEDAVDPHAEFQTHLNQLATEQPQFRNVIAPDRPIRADAISKARAAEHKALDVWERSDGGFSAWSARLAGGLYGAMHDPVNVATLLVGPSKPAQLGVKGLLWMGLKQGAANAGTEAGIQPFVQAWRKEAGLDHGISLAAMNIGLAGLFGFGADAAIRSTVRGGRRLAGRPYLGPDPLPPVKALDDVAKSAPSDSVLRRAADGDEQALRDIARETGQDSDPLIKHMLDEIETERLFPIPERVDGGEHLTSLAKAVREASGADDLPTGDAIMPAMNREISRLADETSGAALEIESKPVGFRSIDPREITADPNTFQFKSGGDVAGVTDRLRGVSRWDPVSAGKAIVFERADGKLVIADGHQRRDLAIRAQSQGQEAMLDAYVFREADGWTPEDVRAYAALKNMRESSGDSTDMAQVMRERPDLIDGSLPLTDAKLRESAMLARLSPTAFDAVLAGRLPPGYAALIGESVADSARHIGLIDELAAANLPNSQQARLYLKQLMDLPTTTEVQHALFGEETFTRTVLRERVKVLDAALRTLRADKRIFGLLEREASTIEGMGNVLARDANQAKADKASVLADLIERLATSRGMVATILNDAAASVARGYNPTLASRAFVARIADTLDRDGINGLLRTTDAIEADLNPRPMDDPMGPEAKAQADEIEALLWAKLPDEAKIAAEDADSMFALRGFYSPAIRAAEAIRQEKGTGEQYWKQITKVPGVRKDELDWMGLEEFLKDKPSITKAEVLEFMRAHQVQLEEKILGGAPSDKALIGGSITPEQFRKRTGASDDAFPDADIQFIEEFSVSGQTFYVVKRNNASEYEVVSRSLEEIGRSTTRAQAEHIGQGWAKANDESPRFSGYKVPGGESYRELLIRMPALEGKPLTAAQSKRLNAINEETISVQDRVFAGDESARERLTALEAERDAIVKGSKAKYTSKHFHDQEIVHLRVDDRTGPNGEKVLFINEVQSDLHQAGRQKGYATKDLDPAYAQNIYAGLFDVAKSPQELATLIRKEITEKAGDPRMVAARPALEAAAFQLDSGMSRTMVRDNLAETQLKAVPDAPFKGDLWLELALKRALLYASENGYDAVSWARSDQIAKAVGAEPEKLALQYDQKIGKFLDKYTKKWGGKVEEDGLRLGSIEDELEAIRRRVSGTPEQANPLLRITPEMRASVLEGQPLAVPRAGQAVETPRPATLRGATLSARAAEEMARIRKEIDTAVSRALPAGWRADVRQTMVFGDLPESLQRRNPGVPPSLEIEGTFDPYERIIYVSMAALDPVERAYEEAGHVLKALRLVPDADYDILRAKSLEINARERFKIDERYGEVYGERWKDNPERLEAALEEEAIMQMVAARARGDDFGKTSNTILDRVIKFFRAVKDMLGLKGFRSFDDVFEDMTGGGFAQQMEQQVPVFRQPESDVSAMFGADQADTYATYPNNLTAEIESTARAFLRSPRQYFVSLPPLDKRAIRGPLGLPNRPRKTSEVFVLHATPVASEFKRFDPEIMGRSDLTNAVYFTDHPALANYYADPDKLRKSVNPNLKNWETPRVFPVFLDTEGFAIIDAGGKIIDSVEYYQDLMDQGYKGAVLKNVLDVAGEPNGGKVPYAIQNQYVTWTKGTVRSALVEDQMFSLKPLTPPSAEADDFLQKSAIVSEAMFALGEDKTAKMPAGKAAKQIKGLINGAAARGELSREDADALIKRYNDLERHHKSADKAKAQLAQEIDADAAHRKRQKALSEAARTRIEATLVRFRDARGQADPAKAMVAMIENLGQHELPEGTLSVANHQRAIYGLALADLDGMLHEFRKTIITGQTRNKAGLSNVVRELFGEETGDELAKAFAVAASGVMEKMRQRFNAAGGAIGQRQDWGLPQAHDKVALIRAGKDAWINYIAPLLDPQRMKHPLTGNALTPADLKTSLDWIYDNIVSDGWHEKEAKMAFQGLGSVANQRGDQRFLVFRDADSWMKYSDQFGSGGDALAVIVNHIRGMSEDIAAMEVFGPNPRAMLTYMQQFVEQQAGRRAAKLPAVFPAVTEVTGREFRPHGNRFVSRDPREYARRMIERSNNIWDFYSGASSGKIGDTLAEVGQTVRNINVATKLGGATISALTDPFWQMAARKFAGLPVTKIIGDVVKQIGTAGQRETRRAGVIADTYLHMHTEAAREAAALSATKISGFLAERVISLSMLNTLTRAGNHAMAMGIQAHLADQAAKSFRELSGPVQRLFRRHGLGESDWNAIRLGTNGVPVDTDFLTPSAVREALKARGGDLRLAERYLAMTLTESQYATATGTLRARAMSFGNTRAGTGVGEGLRLLMQFKSFAVNMAILQIERMAREFVSQGLWRGAQYGTFALMSVTLGGALVIQLKQLLAGKDPRDMTTLPFWGSALYQSGGLSLWGDLLYASENRFGGGIAGTIGGPTFSVANDLANLTYGSATKALIGQGEDTNFGRELAKTVRNSVPGSSLWYLRLAWNRVLMDNLQRTLDPQAEAAFRRQVQNAKKNYKQDFWFAPGKSMPSRAPDIRAAVPALQ